MRFKGINSDFAKLTLSLDIPSKVINNYFKISTILVSDLRNNKVSSAYYKLMTLKKFPITWPKPTK
jgi:hypothetical protein